MSTEWNEDNIREHLFTVVDVSDNGIDWARTKLEGFRSKATYPFVAEGSGWVHMRLITKPKMRLMTTKELWGKTLVSHNGCLVTVNKVDSHNQISMLDSWNTVEEAHIYDWKLAGPDLDYETATSLEVEK